MKTRYQLFIGHYKLLREKRKPTSIIRTLFSAYPSGLYHPTYSMWNCAVCAWSNSRTHNLDGTYLT